MDESRAKDSRAPSVESMLRQIFENRLPRQPGQWYIDFALERRVWGVAAHVVGRRP